MAKAPKSSCLTPYLCMYRSISVPLSETNVAPFEPSLPQCDAVASPFVVAAVSVWVICSAPATTTVW